MIIVMVGRDVLMVIMVVGVMLVLVIIVVVGVMVVLVVMVMVGVMVTVVVGVVMKSLGINAELVLPAMK